MAIRKIKEVRISEGPREIHFIDEDGKTVYILEYDENQFRRVRMFEGERL